MIGLVLHAPLLPQLFAEINIERWHELQRFAEVGRVSARLIHDISSPLTAAILHLEHEEQRGLHSVRQARRSIRVLERYVEAARQQLRKDGEAGTTSFWVKQELSQVKHVLEPLAQRQQVRLRFDAQANYQLAGDPVKFQQIIANLVTNAIDAYLDCSPLPAKPLVQLTVSAEPPWLVIRVRDCATGIAPDQLPHIFEPFYTTKQVSAVSGIGIGLATVKQYVEDSFSGTINVVSTVGEGTEFCVKLQLPASLPTTL